MPEGEYLIVNGSPRTRGNTAYLAGRVAAAIGRADPGARVSELRLEGMDIGPCRGCDACRTGAIRFCAREDGMAPLYPRVEAARGIVLASPVYWFSYSAQLKLFVDRLYGLWTEKTGSLRGKPFGALFVHGDEDAAASGVRNAIGSFEDLVRYVGGLSAGVASGTAGGIGDAEKSPALVAAAEAMGEGLVRLVLTSR